jgi:hypothetical protein
MIYSVAISLISAVVIQFLLLLAVSIQPSVKKFLMIRNLLLKADGF